MTIHGIRSRFPTESFSCDRPAVQVMLKIIKDLSGWKDGLVHDQFLFEFRIQYKLISVELPDKILSGGPSLRSSRVDAKQ